MTVKVGETAPDFTLTSQAGSSVSLEDFRGQKMLSSTSIPKTTPPDAQHKLALFEIATKFSKTHVQK